MTSADQPRFFRRDLNTGGLHGSCSTGTLKSCEKSEVAGAAANGRSVAVGFWESS